MQIRRKRQNRSPGIVKAVVVLLVTGGISFCLAFVWQNVSQATTQVSRDNQREDTEAVVLSQEPVDAASLSADPPPDSGEESAAESLPEESGESDSGEEPENPNAEAVPLSPRVSNIYFEDAIFFGDSLSVGIPLYQVAGNPDTVAFTGINPLSINTSQVINSPQGKLTLLEAAKQYGEKKKVYIMLGGNGLWMDEKSFAEGYQTFLDSVKAQYPGAQIFLQSILPVTEDAHLTYEAADNDVIRGFNKLIIGMAKKNGVYYLDVAQALMDDNGMLPKEASPLDGMHLTPEYYEKWFDYLKTHTVEEK